ncbi:MAG TPA: alpha/beta hydrolase family protein [Pyrinomonadaceae bacterium]
MKEKKNSEMLKSSRLVVAIVLALLASLVSIEARAQATSLGSIRKISDRVEVIRFPSKLMGREMPYGVVVPPGYSERANRSTRYPVLYLLHGLTGHHDDWLTRTKLSDFAAQYRMLIVTPEGENGWYTDGASAPTAKYESYIVEELIENVSGSYRTIERREGRAVAGLSMGGYGALKFGVKHPEKFVFAASMSGAVGAASWTSEQDLPEGFIRRSLVETFGAADSPTHRANDLFRLLRELPAERIAALPFLYLDCGTEDELALLPANRALADILVARKIPHEYRQLPGRHNWQYWNSQVQDVLRLASRRLSPPQQNSRARAANPFNGQIER